MELAELEARLAPFARAKYDDPAAEVSSVNSVDDRPIPCPGPKTQAIADLYGRVVRGQEDQYKDWCELAV